MRQPAALTSVFLLVFVSLGHGSAGAGEAARVSEKRVQYDIPAGPPLYPPLPPAGMPETPPDEPEKDKKVSLDARLEDATGNADIRRTQLRAEARYRLNPASSFGVQAGKEFHDSQDAQAWNKKASTDETATVDYKYRF